MRIRNVTIEGFGPFKERQEADFAAFDADGLFLIGGETGAGKSTILDGIAYALYGSTPRWEDSSATGVGNRVRSDFCGIDEPTKVILEFEANGVEYRVTRSPAYERPKDRGEGTTTQAAKVLVEALESNEWQGLAAKEREAAEVIERVVKLTGDEFLQVILLAQGRFQAFLLANSEERLGLLSKLFGAKRFHDYQERIAARRSLLAKQVEASRMQLTTLLMGVAAPDDLGDTPAGHEIEWINDVIDRASIALQNAVAALASTEAEEKAAAERLDLAKRQRRVADAKARLNALDRQKAEIAATKAALTRAERAERIRPLSEASTEAFDRLEDSEKGVNVARDLYKGHVADGGLPAEVTRLDGEIGKLTDALLEEERAAELDRAHVAKSAAVADLTDELGEIAEQIEALQDERESLTAPAAQAKLRRENVNQIAQRLDAAKAADDAKARLQKAHEAQLAAELEYNAARVAATDLLGRFLHGQAANLAATLVDGEPCAVCGSLDHPVPATWDAEPVDQETLEAVQIKADKLEPNATAAKKAANAVKEEVAGLVGASGAGNVKSITEELKTAKAELATATAADKRISEIEAKLKGDDGLIAGKAEVEQELKTASEDAARLKVERDALQKQLAKLRGDFPTVKVRYVSLAGERETVKKLADALVVFGTATKQSQAAATSLEAKVRQENFESLQDAVEALLDEDEVAELKELVEAHHASVSETQGILKQPELQDLPTELIDNTEAEQSQAAAKAAVNFAVESRANAKTAVDTLQRQRKELQAILAASFDLVAEYETLHRLTETVHGRTPNTKSMSLESYYVAAELEEVLAAANERLGAMSSGRYALQHTERGTRKANAVAGLELEVMDEYTGKARDPHTLSGGEQFLTSLALALGLAEVVTSRTGGVELETLFVDEGFGGLSPEYLDIAMATLDSLKQGGRTVGVISHVESMKESIASQLQVTRSPGGPSVIEQKSVA